MSKNSPVIVSLKRRQRSDGLTQLQLAAALGIHQAHLSKVMAGKVPLSGKLRTRIELFMKGDDLPSDSLDELETELVQAVRTSPALRTLMRAAMQLHRRRTP